MKRTPMPPRKRPLPKRNPTRSRKRYEEAYGGEYATWVREQGCAVPDLHRMAHYGPVQAHHVRTRGAGGKAEANLVGLCHLHHHDIHTWGRQTFEERYRIDLSAVAAELWAEYTGEG